MRSLFPIITITALRKRTKEVFDHLKDYVVVQSHGRDVAMVLHPDLGRVLLESGALREFIAKAAQLRERQQAAGNAGIDMQEFDRLIGQVIRELSRE